MIGLQLSLVRASSSAAPGRHGVGPGARGRAVARQASEARSRLTIQARNVLNLGAGGWKEIYLKF